MSPAPKTLTVTECQQLLEALCTGDGTAKQKRRGIRNYTIALCMLDAGLRVGEVVRLLVSDLWFNNAPVASILIGPDVAEKDCDRQVPVTNRLSAAIEQTARSYWQTTRPNTDGSPGRPCGPAFRLSTRQIERFIGAAAMRSLGRPVHPHVLRHTFATRLMRKTNARIVQQLLGHKRLSSTQIYTHPNQQDLASAIDTLNQPDTQ
ncbi:Tyrosine recombinase XerC [subsurface metagenome]